MFYRFDLALLLKQGLLLLTGIPFAGASVLNDSENRHRTFAKNKAQFARENTLLLTRAF